MPILALIAAISVVSSDAELADFEKVKETGGIEEYRLTANGLSVLLLEDHSAPVVTFGVTYQVGSRNDPVGAAGEAHLLEHMMFRGTARFSDRKGNRYDATSARAGASSNAETDYDCTHYYATVPSEYLDLVTELEADRMRTLSLRDEDRRLESAVVRNEYEEELSASPFVDLLERVYLDVTGADADEGSSTRAAVSVGSVSIAQLRELYNACYRPNNAAVTVVGDFQTEHALDCIKKRFAGIPRSPKPVPHPGRKGRGQRRQRLIVKGMA